MSGNIINRCLWACVAGAAVLIAAQTVHSAEFFSQFVDSILVPWTQIYGTPETTYPATNDGMKASDLALVTGKIALASIAALMGLVLIVRVLISRAIGAMLDG